MPEYLSCTKQLHLMHKLEFLPSPLLHAEHRNLENSIVTVLSPVQKAFVFFTFTFNPFSVTAFFIHAYLISTSSQLFPSSTKS